MSHADVGIFRKRHSQRPRHPCNSHLPSPDEATCQYSRYCSSPGTGCLRLQAKGKARCAVIVRDDEVAGSVISEQFKHSLDIRPGLSAHIAQSWARVFDRDCLLKSVEGAFGVVGKVLAPNVTSQPPAVLSRQEADELAERAAADLQAFMGGNSPSVRPYKPFKQSLKPAQAKNAARVFIAAALTFCVFAVLRARLLGQPLPGNKRTF